ncbi:MAG: AI-2E family transporter [Arachnia sp.]
MTSPSEDPVNGQVSRARKPRGFLRRALGRAGREARTFIVPPPVEPITPVPPPPPAPDGQRRRSPFTVGFLGALGVLVAAALALAVYNVQSVLLLVVLALFLALGLNPAVEFCTRRRMPRPLAVTLVTLVLLGVLALGITAFVPVISEQSTALMNNLPSLLERMAVHPRVSEFEENYQIVEKVEQFITSGSLLNNLFGGILGAGRLVANLVFSVIVTLVLTIYFLASLPTIKETIYALAPASRRARARYLADEIFRGVSGYITGMFVIVAVASVCAFIFMNIAGLGSYSLALAFIVAMFCFIPLVGSSLAMVSVALVGFAVDPTIGIATIIYFLIYQQFDAYVIYPNVMRRTVKVPGALVVLSAIIGGMLFGVIGAVIAIPTTAAVLLLFREIVQPALDAS